MLARLLRAQGEEMSGYCPQWIYSACIGMVIKDFIEKDIPLDLVSKKYSKELSEKYIEVNPDEIASIAEDIVRILAEVDAGSESINYINGFIYFLINFESAGKVRSRKIFLGSIFDGERDLKYENKNITRSFKAYMYSLRSGKAALTPSGWSIEQEEGIDFLRDIAMKEFSIFDAIQQ